MVLGFDLSKPAITHLPARLSLGKMRATEVH